MKNILINILFLLSSFSLYASKDSSIPVQCSPKLQCYVDKIQKIPEARALLASIQKEGPIQIINKNTSLSNQFGAFWDPDQRIICISLSSKTSEGEIIGSILFELHNTLTSSKFDYFDQLAITGKIDKASYVKSMEYLEYKNSISAAKMAEKGIKMGILPSDARLPTYSNFEEHFLMQKKSGHSLCFARNYDSLTNNYQSWQ